MDAEVPPMVDQLEYHPGYMQNGSTAALLHYWNTYYAERAGLPYDPDDRIRTEYSAEECASDEDHSRVCSGFCMDDVPEYCRDRGIIVEAWSPLGRAKVLKHPLLVSLAEKYGKTTSQICLRWELQHGIVPLPKSVHADRIKENTEIFDFDLSASDMSMIDSMPVTGFSTHTPKDVPW